MIDYRLKSNNQGVNSHFSPNSCYSFFHAITMDAVHDPLDDVYTEADLLEWMTAQHLSLTATVRRIEGKFGKKYDEYLFGYCPCHVTKPTNEQVVLLFSLGWILESTCADIGESNGEAIPV
jgi:hypothetical protein